MGYLEEIPEFGYKLRNESFVDHPDYLSRGYIIKVAERCNLNCPYCYMYNLGDVTYKSRPAIMAEDVFCSVTETIRDYVLENSIKVLYIFLHGGEPLLLKKERFERYVSILESRLTSIAICFIHVQTNGTLIDEEWARIFKAHNIGVGISLDGPPSIHNKFRINTKNQGTYSQTLRGIKWINSVFGSPPKVLCVIDPYSDSIETFKHFVSIGIKSMDFLLPDYHHSSKPPFPQTQLLEYLIKLFDYWYSLNDPEIEIRFFISIMRALVGAKTGIDALGVHPISEIVFESDGNMQPLDMLRTCENGITTTNCFAGQHSINELRQEPIFIAQLENQNLLPQKCVKCRVLNICGGGYLPHRYSAETGFSNPSIHCETLYRLITHIEKAILKTAGARCNDLGPLSNPLRTSI